MRPHDDAAERQRGPEGTTALTETAFGCPTRHILSEGLALLHMRVRLHALSHPRVRVGHGRTQAHNPEPLPDRLRAPLSHAGVSPRSRSSY